MTALPVQRRRRSVLMVLAVALTLALLPHPKSPKGAIWGLLGQYRAMIQL